MYVYTYFISVGSVLFAQYYTTIDDQWINQMDIIPWAGARGHPYLHDIASIKGKYFNLFIHNNMPL